VQVTWSWTDSQKMLGEACVSMLEVVGGKPFCSRVVAFIAPAALVTEKDVLISTAPRRQSTTTGSCTLSLRLHAPRCK
jgi:hypothetical protein